MELLIIIAGIVLIWKFGSSLNGLAISAQAKTEVLSEKVTADAVVDRTENFDEFQKRMDGKQIYSHDEIMSAFKVSK